MASRARALGFMELAQDTLERMALLLESAEARCGCRVCWSAGGARELRPIAVGLAAGAAGAGGGKARRMALFGCRRSHLGS